MSQAVVTGPEDDGHGERAEAGCPGEIEEEMDVTQTEQAGPMLDQWTYLMLEVVPWLDGWQYVPLDDKGLPLEHAQRMALGVEKDPLNPPGLSAYGDLGWEVTGVIPEMRLYSHGQAFHSTQKTVLLLKRRKP